MDAIVVRDAEAGAQDSANRLIALGGTHRVCTAEVTLERVAPALPKVGVTRLADVTALDEIGIPVYQAIRPDSRTLSVSQGKGLTRALAKVSAAMEATELWHAENIGLPTVRGAIGEVVAALPYDLTDLCMAERHFLHPGRELDWVHATCLTDGTTTLVPEAYIRLDAAPRTTWSPPLLNASSNGLASGNTFAEATLHGLYEVLERDSEDRADLEEGGGADRALDLETVDGPGSRWLLERLWGAGMTVCAFDITGATGVPAFTTRIWSKSMPAEFLGHGCHLDRDVALCRALSEAAQSRLTVIAGSRDDISREPYSYCADYEAQAIAGASDAPKPARSFTDAESLASLDLARDLAEIVSRIVRYVGHSPIVVDLTQAEVGVPVARVVAPGLGWSPEH